MLKYQDIQEQKLTKPDTNKVSCNFDKKKEQLNNYFSKKDNNDTVIDKIELENAIQLFISLVLFRENDKDTKIKSNCKNITIKSTSPSSAQNRVINKRMKNVINNKRSKDLEYIINKGEDLKNRMKNLLNNYITLSSDIKKKYMKTEVK